MLRGLVCLLGITPALALGGSGAPMNWSPDGRWIAYTVPTRVGRPVFSAGWLFENSGAAPPWKVGEAGDRRNVPDRFRIYAADAETGTALLLYESRGPLTSPAWRPDGRALAFGRVVDEAPAPARFELIVQDAPGENRVIVSQAFGERPPADLDWTAQAPAWSPDGQYLVIPGLKSPAGLSVIQAENGHAIKSIEGTAAAWSMDGTKLVFLRTERTASLLLTDVGLGPVDRTGTLPATELSFGPPKHLVDLGQSSLPPIWSRDGKSVLALARRVVLRGRGPTLQVDLLRIKVDSGWVETVAHLTPDPIEDEKSFRGVTLSYDRDVDQLFYALDVDEQPWSAIVWSRPKTQETVDRFNPLDTSIRVGSLSLSPDGKTLAIRFGDEGHGTIALFDVVSRKLTLLAPDDPARLEWVSLFISTAKRLLAVSLPPPSVEGRSIGRPTIIPVPGEIPGEKEILLRLQRLGGLGRPLCDPLEGPAACDPAFDTFVKESRLFFDALREDYPAALESLEALEARTDSPNRLERLLAVRAQLFLGTKDVDRAGDTIGFLKALEDVAVSRLEVTPAGTTLTTEPLGTKGWAHYLAERLDDLKAGRPGPGAEMVVPSAPAVPMAPPFQPLPFDRLPNGAFAPPRGARMPAPIAGDAPEVQIRIARPRRIPGPPPPRPPLPFRIP